MKESQKKKLVGTEHLLTMGELMVVVRVLSAKRAWGHDRVEVEPCRGYGSQWVNLARLDPLSLMED